MNTVAVRRVNASDALGGKESAETLEHRLVLCQLTTIKALPRRVVDDFKALEKILRIGQAEGLAHSVESVPVRLVEVKERVVGVKEQIGITCHSRISFDFLL